MISLLRSILLLALATLSATAAEPVVLTGRAMGTTWVVKFFQPSPPLNPVTLNSRIAEKIELLEQQFSTYRPSSEISRFNASTSADWIAVSPEIVRVANESRRISVLTRGAFDVTIEPLVRLWGFGAQRRTQSLPTAAEITDAKSRVNYRQLEMRSAPPSLRKPTSHLAVDFSSMVKGFTADAISALLLSLNAADHTVQVGGDIKTAGHPPDAVAWRFGIEQPSTTEKSVAQTVVLTGLALSTSGDLHNFFEHAGRRYGHIIDPRTGEPVNGRLASVSVVHASCAQSSALATALFVLGADAGFALAEKEHLACLFILRDGEKFIQRATPEFTRVVAQP